MNKFGGDNLKFTKEDLINKIEKTYLERHNKNFNIIYYYFSANSKIKYLEIEYLDELSCEGRIKIIGRSIGYYKFEVSQVLIDNFQTYN